LIKDGLFPEPADTTRYRYRISPEPFYLTRDEAGFFESLGGWLLLFYKALNRLYSESLHGRQPGWVAAYLDQGKPDGVTAYARMNRFQNDLPGVIRPDLLRTETGWIATELDSVVGGIGLTAGLCEQYAAQGFQPIGGPNGMITHFGEMIRTAAKLPNPTVAIVVSEESKDYRPEMRHLADRLRREGLSAHTVTPEEIGFTEEGLTLTLRGRPVRVDVVYRFFELFDLPNIPKAELILYSAKKRTAALTPPAKPFLEEKLAMALVHHPRLRSFWTDAMGEGPLMQIERLFPKTWIVDPRPVPPYGVIPDLSVRGRPVSNWEELTHTTQKERRLVLKPSGFSELAWGSRGVVVGHDVSQGEWAGAIRRAIASFPHTPWILQEFHKTGRHTLSYYDFSADEARVMEGRARISPYYMVVNGRAVLSGVLATVCPPDKKLIHGMTDAIMAPCAVKE
jgi:hypothetical protein